MTLEQVVADALRVPADSLDDDSGPLTVDAWTSFRHVSVIVAIEKHYAVKLPREVVFGAGTLRELRDALRGLGVET